MENERFAFLPPWGA